MKKSVFTIAQALLLMAIRIDVATAEARPWDYLTKIKDGVMYLRGDITGLTGRAELIDSTTSRTVGVSSFDKTRLPSGQRMVLEQVRIAFAEVANTNTATAINQTFSTNYADCPAPLRGAHLIITQGGEVKLDMPIERMLARGSVEKNVGEDGYYLPSPRMLEPDVETTISIRYPDSAAAAAYTGGKKQFFELLLLGPLAQIA